MGRRKKPEELKILHGDFKKNPQRRNPNPVEPPRDKPVCPRHLKGAARAEWRFLSEKLEACGLLSSADRGAMELYCACYAEWRKAEKAIEQEGAVVEVAINGGRDVMKQVNPWVSVRRSAHERCVKLLVQFGFTPSARAGLQSERTAKEKQGVMRRAR